MPYTEKEIRQILKIRCEEEDVEMSEVRYGEIWGDMGRYGEEDVEMSEERGDCREETRDAAAQPPTAAPHATARVPDGR